MFTITCLFLILWRLQLRIIVWLWLSKKGFHRLIKINNGNSGKGVKYAQS